MAVACLPLPALELRPYRLPVAITGNGIAHVDSVTSEGIRPALVTIPQQASYFAKHDRYHLPQIEAIRKVVGA